MNDCCIREVDKLRIKESRKSCAARARETGKRAIGKIVRAQVARKQW